VLQREKVSFLSSCFSASYASYDIFCSNISHAVMAQLSIGSHTPWVSQKLIHPHPCSRSLRIEIKREALTSAPQILIIFLSFLCIERTFTRALVSERTFGELTHILIEQGYKFQRLMEIDDVSPFAQKPQLSSSNAIFN